MPRYSLSSAVRFHPWIGAAFEGNGRGMLVLGNSHYGEPGAYRQDLTEYVVRSYPDVYGRAFFTKLTQALSNLSAKPATSICTRRLQPSLSITMLKPSLQNMDASGPLGT